MSSPGTALRIHIGDITQTIGLFGIGASATNLWWCGIVPSESYRGLECSRLQFNEILVLVTNVELNRGDITAVQCTWDAVVVEPRSRNRKVSSTKGPVLRGKR